jgi:hypothetical protein
MNVFILSTGRCGSTTFIRACGHISNYTASHERNMGRLGAERTDFPAHHIAADTRMAWFLGRLEETHGRKAFYVHLQRDPQAVARSYAQRWYIGITKAYREGILEHKDEAADRVAVAADYVHTVNSNITHFLRDKPHRMTFRLEHAADDFRVFWERIGAEGDAEAALAEFLVRHNAGARKAQGLISRGMHKAGRLLSGLPRYVREA